MARARTYFAIACLLSVAVASSAAACKCRRIHNWPFEPIDVAGAVEGTDYVFYGKAVSQLGARTSPLRGEVAWNFDVTAVWKGPTSNAARIFGQSKAGIASTCDREFEVGKIYVVFAFQDKEAASPHFQASLCSLTTEVKLESPVSREIMGRLGDPLPMRKKMIRPPHNKRMQTDEP